MTQEQIEELRKFAIASKSRPDLQVEHVVFRAAANPAVILELIAEIETLRDQRQSDEITIEVIEHRMDAHIEENKRLRDQVNGLTGTLERVETERNNQILRNHNLMVELRESRRNDAITMGWLADCRTASGDNGERMLPAFVEYLRDLKQRADK